MILLQNIENRNPVLAGRFHTDIGTVIFGKPVTQLMQSFGKGRKASLLIFRTAVGIGNTNAGKDPSFVDVKTPACLLYTSDAADD